MSNILHDSEQAWDGQLVVRQDDGERLRESRTVALLPRQMVDGSYCNPGTC